MSFCRTLENEATVLSRGSGILLRTAVFKAGAQNGGDITFTVAFYDSSCDPGTPQERQTVDFKVMWQHKCYENLYSTIAFSCAISPGGPGYDKEFTVLGGTWGSGCALWSLTSDNKSIKS